MRAITLSIGAVLIMTTMSQTASAQEADLVMPIDTVIVAGGPEGSRVELAEASSGPLNRQLCDVRAVHRGESAAHPGNNLIVISGDETTTLADVESSPGAVTEATEPITLAEIITVELEMGTDSAFGGDIDVEFYCPATADDQAGTDEASLAAQTSLPVTGSETSVGIVLGTLLLAAGVALVSLARWRSPLTDHGSV